MTLKNLYKHTFLVIVILASTMVNAQPTEVDAQKLAEFKAAIEKDSNTLRETLEQYNYNSEFEEQREVEFTLDTFRIERMMQLRLSTDYSTRGMVEAGNEAEAGYDKLLNKYYQVLLNRLKEEDKEILKQAQRNWIAYRDSEKKLNGLLTDDTYSGGGTIQSVIAMSRSLELTKKRVFEIREYLGRVIE